MRPIGELRGPDMLLVPLLAFDRRGRRLGYGGGFYDRTLAALPALSPGLRLCGATGGRRSGWPRRHRLDAVATEDGVIDCGDLN